MAASATDTWRAWVGAVSLFVLFSGIYLLVAYNGQPEKCACENLISQSEALDQQAYRVVREVVSQASALPGQESETTFYLGKMIAETMRLPSPAAPRPPQASMLDEATLQQLHTKHHLLSAADLPYIRRQMTHSAGFRLRPELVPGHSLMPTDTLVRLYSKYGFDWYSSPALQKRYSITHLFSLSKPLLSCDGQTAIMEINYHCGGKCGLERKWVLKRRGGKWHKTREMGYIIY